MRVARKRNINNNNNKISLFEHKQTIKNSLFRRRVAISPDGVKYSTPYRHFYVTVNFAPNHTHLKRSKQIHVS